MEQGSIFILFIIFSAYTFDFINGFHDAANSIATIVTTGVLTPRQAVIWAAFFNFIPFLFFNMTVAETIGKGLVDGDMMGPTLIFSALIAAIFWGIATWYYGLPTSLSQALIGALVGGAIIHGGLESIKWQGASKIVIGVFVAPIAGLLASMALTWILTYFLKDKDTKSVNKFFKGMQLASSACLSMAHGSNDAQKTMGIITILLFSVSWLEGPFVIPLWVIISCHLVISLGTLSGGWRIVKTVGTKITELNPMRGCSAETGATMAIFAATDYGIPVSTTQTVTGAIAGVGLVNGLSGTCWPMLRLIFFSWFITMPVTGALAALIMWFID
ncbi:MAG: inorganic phosphate transporter [Legionellaceae bacterium]|nr:inorganic phosphate transporter [Legionellaceae bacterium]